MKALLRLAVATALAGTATFAQAAIITTNVNITVPSTIDGVYVNVITGQTSTTEFAGYDFNPYNNGAGITFYTPLNGGTVVAAATGTTSQALNLAPGAVIGASSIFQQYQVRGDLNFNNAGPHIVGFKFLNETTGIYNYGYMNITTTAGTGANGGFPATITGWTYDNTGAALTVAGAATPGVPEPATWAMMMLGFGAMGAALRRRKTDIRIRYA